VAQVLSLGQPTLPFPDVVLYIPTVRCPSRSGECMPIAPTKLIHLCGDHSRHKLCSHNWVGASRPTNNIRESVRFITLKSGIPVILRKVPPRTPQRVNFIPENECCVCLCGDNLVKARRNKTAHSTRSPPPPRRTSASSTPVNFLDLSTY